MATQVMYSPSLASSHAQYFDRPATTAQPKRTTAHVAHNVYGEFNYYPQELGVPEPVNVMKPSSFLNDPKETRKLLVEDVRGRESDFSLETSGFQFVNHETIEKEFRDDESIKRDYYPEIENLVKELTGASDVRIHDHTIRREANNEKATSYDSKAAKATRQQGPVRRVHIDQSYTAAPDVVRRHCPDEAEQLLAGRFQIINVWRPIKPIYRDPLAVVDARTTDAEDLMPVELIYPNRTSGSFTVKPGKPEGQEQHKWYYLYGQQPQELLMFKCYDSKTDGRPRGVPHSAFTNEEEAGKESRESVEVRCLVFHADDTT
ncbi:hypothetical protein MMC25_000894 [Agyrium rufum]|nr:hypothetical protein [Agyrium rufum]